MMSAARVPPVVIGRFGDTGVAVARGTAAGRSRHDRDRPAHAGPLDAIVAIKQEALPGVVVGRASRVPVDIEACRVGEWVSSSRRAPRWRRRCWSSPVSRRHRRRRADRVARASGRGSPHREVVPGRWRSAACNRCVTWSAPDMLFGTERRRRGRCRVPPGAAERGLRRRLRMVSRDWIARGRCYDLIIEASRRASMRSPAAADSRQRTARIAGVVTWAVAVALHLLRRSVPHRLTVIAGTRDKCDLVLTFCLEKPKKVFLARSLLAIKVVFVLAAPPSRISWCSSGSGAADGPPRGGLRRRLSRSYAPIGPSPSTATLRCIGILATSARVRGRS